MAKFKLKKLKVKNTRMTLKYFFRGGFWCFLLNESGTIKTVMKPTDDSLDYFHIINVENDETVTPICGPISRFELTDEFDFTKPKMWKI